MTDLTGSTIGQYHIHEMIGHGGMADVYLADQSSIGRQVAIKVLPGHFLQDRTFLQRFMQEVKVIAGLQHPHILPVHDFGEYNGMPYIVMAYLTGGSLAEHIHRVGGLSLAESVRLTGQIAGGLEYAHENGIIHRDFKPSNVLLDSRGNAYLADFGIAKITESNAQLTGSGIVGTPAYMAPEMAQKGGVTPLVDVYALGVTLYQMLTVRQPYEADTPMGVILAHMNQPIPDVRVARPDLPDAAQTVIERAMAKDPMDRYQSPGELVQALSSIQAGQPVHASQPQQITNDNEATLVEAYIEEGPTTLPKIPTQLAPPEPAPKRVPKKRSAMPVIAIVAALLALILVGAGILILPRLSQGQSPIAVLAAAEPLLFVEPEWTDTGTASISGKFTAADGSPLAGKSIDLTITPVDGGGVPGELTLSGTVPAGIQRANVGLRINMECDTCSGPAEINLYEARYTQAGSSINRVPNPSFSSGIDSWGFWGDVIPRIQKSDLAPGSMMVISAATGKSIGLNSGEFTVTAGTAYELTFSARISPESVRSGYFAIFFLDSDTAEGSREMIRFRSTQAFTLSATTGSDGTFSIPVESLPSGEYQVDVAFAGDDQTSPAEAQAVLPPR